MKSGFDHTAYSTIVFIDSMVVLECKPLKTLPWHEIDPDGPILVLAVPQVLTEVDNRKRDGRLAKRAREFNRTMRPAVSSDAPVNIRDETPQVDICPARTGRVDWDELHDLDPNEGDARIVAEILHTHEIPKEKKILLSHDINPLTMARRHGLSVFMLPESWLLDPEPSPDEKKLTKLKARMRELEAQEPNIAVKINFGVEAPFHLHCVQPLTMDEQRELSDRLRSENPKKAQNVGRFTPLHRHDHEYDGKYIKYLEVEIPEYVTNMHIYLERRHNQIPLCMTVINDGYIQAENLVITLHAEFGGLHTRFIVDPLFGPSPPTPENKLFIGPLPPTFDRGDFISNAGRHDVVFAAPPDGGSTIEIHCEDFRHGRSWSFDGIACIDPHAEQPFWIDVSVTASNMRGGKTARFELDLISESVNVDDLLDLENRRLRKQFPMQAEFDQAVEAENFDWFEFPESNEG